MGKIFTLGLVFFFSLLRLQAQQLTLASFEEKSLSDLHRGSRSREIADGKLTPWRVYTEGNRLKIEVQEWKRPIIENLPFEIDKTCGIRGLMGWASYKKVANGWLVIRFCELYSDLSWYSNDGKLSYVISGGQYDRFVDFKGKVIAFHNPSHMGFLSGGIYEIYFDKREGKWKLDEIYKSPDSYPIAITSGNDGNDFIATSSALVKISRENKVEYLIKDMYGPTLSTPNSVALHDGSIYLGMHGGILRVTEKMGSVEVKWLGEKLLRE